MPLPIMEFSTSPVKLQRPMARTSSGRACFAVEAPKDREGGSVACVSSGLTASSVAEHGGLLHPPRRAAGTVFLRSAAGFISLGWHGDGLDPLGSELQGGCVE